MCSTITVREYGEKRERTRKSKDKQTNHWSSRLVRRRCQRLARQNSDLLSNQADEELIYPV
jgi:hypothetical protein